MSNTQVPSHGLFDIVRLHKNPKGWSLRPCWMCSGRLWSALSGWLQAKRFHRTALIYEPYSLYIHQRDIFGVVDVWRHWRFSFFFCFFFLYSRRRAGNALFSFIASGKCYLPFKQTAGAIEVGCVSFLKHYYVYFSPVNSSYNLGT